MSSYEIKETKTHKSVISEDYNYWFDKRDGFFARWGKTPEEDPEYSPFGPEILDLEISQNGCPNGCKFCYKNSTNAIPTNMSFDTFKTILSKFPKTLTQIAFGITGVRTNPDFIKMLQYSREEEIIPNFTLSGIDIDDETAKEIVKYIGAVAVSVYETDKNICFNTVKKFVDLGIKQTNIHLTVMQENIKFVYEVLEDIKKDIRLHNLNAVVLLKVKPKGRAKANFNCLSTEEYNKMFDFCETNKINYGMDSCTARNYELYLKKVHKSQEEKKQINSLIESCESFGMFSSYINVNGNYFPCSFTEGEGEWKDGLSVLDCTDFIKDIWFNEKTIKYRKESLESLYETGCRKCLTFDSINPD